jgi:hypothetical protein
MILYRTPMGTFETWETAAAAVELADMDPCTCVEICTIDRSQVSWEDGYKLERPVTVY